MPSPFPGMDPFLETSNLWPDVHHGLISEMQAMLNRALKPQYHVRIEERVYISDENDPGRSVIVPDVCVVARESGAGNWVGGTGVTVAEPVVATTLIDDEIHEARLEIIDCQQRRVITVIEVLSPTNKVPGARGQASYQQKRQEVMQSPSHLVEIDLLRSGVGIFARETLPPHDYLVHISQRDRRPKGTVWPILLQQKLPVIPIPLKPNDPDTSLDLQIVLNTAYDRGSYDLEINYQGNPMPMLTERQMQWAKEKVFRC